MNIPELFDRLETCYGRQSADWPVEPFPFLVWWHCGYPASDAACHRGWASLEREIGTGADAIAGASVDKLTLALKPGGLIPELRALRLLEIVDRIQTEFDGDLSGALRRMPVSKAGATLRKFPGIAGPGADRILLFGGISPVAAVPSNCPQVLVRIRNGEGGAEYKKTYAAAQRLLDAGVPVAFDARVRGYLLLKRHGQDLCRRSNPKCNGCPIAPSCQYVANIASTRGN